MVMNVCEGYIAMWPTSERRFKRLFYDGRPVTPARASTRNPRQSKHSHETSTTRGLREGRKPGVGPRGRCDIVEPRNRPEIRPQVIDTALDCSGRYPSGVMLLRRPQWLKNPRM